MNEESKINVERVRKKKSCESIIYVKYQIFISFRSQLRRLNHILN